MRAPNNPAPFGTMEKVNLPVTRRLGRRVSGFEMRYEMSQNLCSQSLRSGLLFREIPQKGEKNTINQRVGRTQFKQYSLEMVINPFTEQFQVEAPFINGILNPL